MNADIRVMNKTVSRSILVLFFISIHLRLSAFIGG